MNYERALLVEKYTEYEYYMREGTIGNLDKERSRSVARSHMVHNCSTTEIENLLKGIFKKVDRIKPDMLKLYNPESYDLSVTGGGDATFIAVASMLDKGVILGVNTTPSQDDSGSYGGLCSITANQLDEIEKLKTDSQFQIQEWLRLGANLNGQKLPYLSSNEIYIGSAKGYKASHLSVEIDGVLVNFTGSGLVAATPMGSTAWFSSITDGHVIDPKSFAYGLACREVFLKREKPAWQKRTVEGSRHTIVTARRDKHIIVFDGLEETERMLKSNDKIDIYVSDKPLHVVTFG